MKPFHLIPLIFLTACSTTPKLTLQPRPPTSAMDESAVRYPEIISAYHVGRYVDPNDDLVMHEQHVVYRVKENTRWNFHPGPADGFVPALPPARDAAFSPVPVNNDILAEVNSQRIATAQIMAQVRVLSAALVQFQAALHQTKTNLQETAVLRAAVIGMNQRLDVLEAVQKREATPAFSTTTNEPPASLTP